MQAKLFMEEGWKIGVSYIGVLVLLLGVTPPVGFTLWNKILVMPKKF